MSTALAMSLALQHVNSQRKWVMLAACTSKSLSEYLEANSFHWENRFKHMLAKLRSGRARFEILRYVSCCKGDPFYMRNVRNPLALEGFVFTVSIVDPRRFARQAVPQLKQLMGIMKKWDADGHTDVTFTAKKTKASREAGCEQMHFVCSIPVRIASTPTALVTGSLDALADWVDTRDDESGYDTGDSWECDECGESYSASC